MILSDPTNFQGYDILQRQITRKWYKIKLYLNDRLIRSRTRSTKFCNFQWPWMTVAQIWRARHYSTLNVSETIQTRVMVSIQWNANRNSHTLYSTAKIRASLSDFEWQEYFQRHARSIARPLCDSSASCWTTVTSLPLPVPWTSCHLAIIYKAGSKFLPKSRN